MMHGVLTNFIAGIFKLTHDFNIKTLKQRKSDVCDQWAMDEPDVK